MNAGCRASARLRPAPIVSNAHAAQQVDRVEQRFPAPIHRVIARHRHDVEPAIGEHRCHRGRQAAVAATGTRVQRAALGINPLDLCEADVGAR